jgi:putative transposase
VEIEVPRDRDSSFEPMLVKKRQRRLSGFDQKVLSLYARGMSVRDIQAEFAETYGADVSPTLISNVTNAVMEDVKAWRSRPLSEVYPILYFDALVVKSRQEGPVKNRAVYLALGINLQGEKELLGLWIAQSEGSKFWLSIFNELKSRGVKDCFIACVDGLKGLEAIEAVFPDAQVQLCIVHKLRNSFKFVAWKDRKEVAKDLKAVYGAATLAEAGDALDRFSEKWDLTRPSAPVGGDWQRLTVFFDYSPEIRKVIYTTNAIESLNYSLRKVLKTRSSFPNDNSIMKVLYLAINRIAKKWTMPIRNWKAALNQFVIMFGQRVPG